MFFTSVNTFLQKIAFQYILAKVLEDPEKNKQFLRSSHSKFKGLMVKLEKLTGDHLKVILTIWPVFVIPS